MRGKDARLRRILENGKAVVIPMDHGLTDGPIKGIENIRETVELVSKGGATAVLLHKGILKQLEKLPDCGLIMHLSGSTALGPDHNWKVAVGTVEEAVKLGVEAVSIHINIGAEKEPEMLKHLGQVSRDCEDWGMPLIAMMYPRGKNIDSLDPKAIAHASRIGAELGADIIKTPFTGKVNTFQKVVEGCPVPIIIAGGPKTETDRETLQMVKDSMDAGAIGVAMGRNAFQHQKPMTIVKAVSEIVKKNASVEEALQILGSK
ncbi:MAG: 2-amino-3,7-dideoxy-D-threo-hept-6-ulosonate synthase [Candidatus Jordarchaeum sp.]|uniref:2-amino-3,7-dideoxy-D-threo-hept-6-ulosonate synthase n=1 Tax=Candidatus Jordarchaeum sp. TaxID=2823881 RepID=UPI004049F4A0